MDAQQFINIYCKYLINTDLKSLCDNIWKLTSKYTEIHMVKFKKEWLITIFQKDDLIFEKIERSNTSLSHKDFEVVFNYLKILNL
jgi:hypothetical protein